jgi:peptidoglycan-N-acetylglucosamine deacetylase
VQAVFRLGLLLTLLLASPAWAGKRIALSFDDVPRHRGAWFTPDERSARLLGALKSARVRQAAFFVTPGNLEVPDGEGGTQRIASYAAAGHVIANHSFSHKHLTAMTAEDYLADIDRASAWLRSRRGYRPWFRFPFLNEGRSDYAKRDALRAGLAVRGLRNGYVTVDAADWHLDNLANQAKASGLQMDMGALRDLYVSGHVEAANFNHALAKKTTGRDPAHVMLLHETDIAAMFLADLVAALRADGWEIITADRAYKDPIRHRRPNVPSAQGTLTEALAWEKGLPAPRWPEAADTKRTEALFREKVLKL